MKNKSVKIIVAAVMAFVMSCDEPVTIVTNYVHPDGSVTRKIEMRSLENKFEMGNLQVPFDSTWTIRDSIEIGEKGDTIWIQRAEKLFKNMSEINLAYKTDTGPNKNILRNAGFEKRFRWFNTEFRFSEKIDQKLLSGYPVESFLNEEELAYFYAPDEFRHSKENGPDSLKFRSLFDSVRLKTDDWHTKNIFSEWIEEFSTLTNQSPDRDFSKESLKAREEEFAKVFAMDEELDSLWSNGIILREILGDTNSIKFKSEADTAMDHVIESYFVDFREYSVGIVMPGKLTATNGFIDSSQILIWPVKSDYFLTEPYEMWAESRIPNAWAWIVSVIFLLFVLTGVVFRIMKKD
jgi:hypothetical protein